MGFDTKSHKIQRRLRRGGLTSACDSAHARNGRGCHRQTEAVNVTLRSAKGREKNHDNDCRERALNRKISKEKCKKREIAGMPEGSKSGHHTRSKTNSHLEGETYSMYLATNTVAARKCELEPRRQAGVSNY